jgi:hypothetical protein
MYASEHQAALLREAVEEIKKHPETFDMTTWAEESGCGTVCCLAGQIVWNTSTPEEWREIVSRAVPFQTADDETGFMSIGHRAAKSLGLAFDDERWQRGPLGRLFLVQWWPEQFAPLFVHTCDEGDPGYCECEQPNPTPEQLEARVEHWINTGE